MIVYWFFYVFAAFFALIGNQRKTNNIINQQSINIDGLWWVFIFALTILIGLRHEVGGDWDNYIRIFKEISLIEGLSEISLSGDPGYQILNYFSHLLGFGIYGVNFICALIFSIGLTLFCRNLPRPFLALAVAIPYLIIVVSMGYSRQAVAIGLAMIGLVCLGRNKKLLFIFLIFFATTLHKSAILLLPIYVLSSTKNKFWSIVWLGIVAISFFIVFVADTLASVYSNYTNLEDMASQSDGAFIRLAMNLVPACIYLLFYRRFNLSGIEKPLWWWFSIITIGLMILYFVLPASSALDRIALYMIPLQLVVFSYLPDIFGRSNAVHRWIILAILCYYSFVLFVWLNFATYSFFWLPYQNLIFLW
jgi:hypothetical protein